MKIIFSIFICLTLAYSAKGQKFATPEVWSSTPFLGYGSYLQNSGSRTFVADVDGNGKNDIIAIKSNGIFVRRSNGCTFTNDELWLSGSFGGSFDYDEYIIADINGDGAADLIKINEDNMSAKLSNGSTYESSPWTVWLNGNFLYVPWFYFADVNGDGKKDYVRVLYGLGTYVNLSTGSNFMPGTYWGNKAYMESGLFADADGDGKADLVDELKMNGESSAYFYLSLGDKFSSSYVYQEQDDKINAYAYADFTGDGRVDILFKTNDLMIKRSTGDSFSDYETWQNGNDLDNNYNYFADVTGDGRADIIMFSQNDVRVKRTINDCYVTGPDLVCYSGSGSTFTLNDPPSGCTVSWTCTSINNNLAINPTSGLAYATNSTPGQGTISAVVNPTTCGDITFTKTVWLGVPIIRNVSGPRYNQVGASAIYPAIVDGISPTSSYNWSLIPGIFNNYFNPGGLNCYVTWYRSGEYVLTLNVQNTCTGTSATYYYPITVAAGRYLSISPNPATGETTLELVSDSKEPVAEYIEWSLEIYDPMQRQKDNIPKVKGCRQKINTSSWKDGVYIVRANVNGKIVTGKLVVKK